ncbi:hypothetical protein LRP52_35975 [Photobacterium sp. ZSDE20]|uniref:Uncharacterized protein n=1 Tax=Photobacterium pectinilyticum TaxID=2906793 RepID=A0ABT1N5W2_9GAMM|nr:hypothetical protein [Photobacterium sp. ZSDE20]MCQ1060128.1 hypothetical protein [Photobacterium sp. ZSDE20]MDD1827584.1 hypothetical protein [Photobacterium sp. ZSDE20]
MVTFQTALQFLLDNAFLTAFWLFVAWILWKSKKSSKSHLNFKKPLNSKREQTLYQKFSYKMRPADHEDRVRGYIRKD